MYKVEILKKHGAEEIKYYSLISNYGYTFSIRGNKFDIRFWANCYGAEINRWSIHSCGDVQMPKELREQIEAEFNEQGAEE